MKKYLLALAVIVGALSANAADITLAPKPELRHDKSAFSIKATSSTKPLAPVVSRGESDEVYYTLAEGANQGLGFDGQSGGMQVAMAFQIEPSFLSGLQDAQITEISYYTGSQSDEYVNKITKATVFITDDLSAKNFTYTQTVNNVTTEAFAKVDVPLETVFNIPAGKKIYVGVYFTLNDSKNVSVVVDDEAHLNDKGGWVAFRQNSLSAWKWDNIASSFGFVAVGAKIKSSNMPKNSVSVLAVDGQPVAYENDPFAFSFMLQNNGINDINNIDIEFGIDGEELFTERFVLDEMWSLNQIVVASVPEFVAHNATKSSDVTVKVVSVDGTPNTSVTPSASYPVTIVPVESKLSRNVVIEEFTSTKCSACPVGYTAMEQIHSEATDGRIIPVCIHVNVSGNDPMTSTSYKQVFDNLGDGTAPSALVNRQYNVYPYYNNLMTTAVNVRDLPGVAAVTAEATLDKDTRTITIKTKTSFAFNYTDGANNFILSYGITQNNVGPYTQTNGYAGAEYTYPGDWQDKPSSIQLMYNDVARQLDTFSGVKGSIPAEITAGSTYEFTHDVTLLQVIKDNFDDLNIVVYLINRKTKAIENACMLKSAGDGSFSGIDTVVAEDIDADAPVEYYNLQGIRVSEPAGGVFIRRQGSKVSKVLIR